MRQCIKTVRQRISTLSRYTSRARARLELACPGLRVQTFVCLKAGLVVCKIHQIRDELLLNGVKIQSYIVF